MPPASAGSSVTLTPRGLFPGESLLLRLCLAAGDEDEQKHQRGTVIKEPQGSVCLFSGGGFGPIF